ncbi:MAG: hypothetical protein HY763_06590 [Planctomycetes bacterium]|nr:hypothetical protein [Planctomycetota bacterium]
MLMPFVLDVVTRYKDGFTAVHTKADLLLEHGLDIPEAVVRVLLHRAVGTDYLTHEAGLFFQKNAAPPPEDLRKDRKQLELDQGAIAAAFVAYARTVGQEIQGTDEALRLLVDFLDNNHVRLLLGGIQVDGSDASDRLTPRDTRLVASFICNACAQDEALRATLQRMLQGFVLYNALLLRDVSSAQRRFANLTVFFDTPFLFDALGLGDAPGTTAARETLEVLQTAKAKLAVFDVTIREVRRVLKVYSNALKSADGARSLRPTPLTRFFLTSRYTPADVEQCIALLEKNLRALGVVSRPTPDRVARLTLNERALAERLRADTDQEAITDRVMHDVDCVAGVLTLRGGNVADTWDRAMAVFATTSRLVVKNVRLWYSDSGERGIPPIIHVHTLQCLAWLKNPKQSTQLHLHQLVALCAAALRPSERIWRAFLAHLGRLQTSGELSSDEAVAMVASELTDHYLSEVPDGGEADSHTLREVVDRVRAKYSEEAARRVRLAEEAAIGEKEQRRQQELRVNSRVRAIASWVGNGTFCLLTMLVLYVTFYGVPSNAGFGSLKGIMSLAVGIVAIVLSACGSIKGTTVSDVRTGMVEWLNRRLQLWFLGNDGGREVQ